MGMYYCIGCDRHIDNDWHPITEHELCPDCDPDTNEVKADRRIEQVFACNQQLVGAAKSTHLEEAKRLADDFLESADEFVKRMKG